MATKETVLSTLPKDLPLDFLRTITNNFSADSIIGTGGFGTVYKGIMPDEQPIAVKKLAENAPLARDKAFTNEVQNMMALRNDNIVKLLGYCHEGQKKVVQNNGRYIVADVFEEPVWIPIIHMDLKPENILLDHHMTPKIADFGLSRLFGQEQTRANTQNVVGSYGYIAPEYLYRGEISAQSDIYSLGLLIIETTTGEKNQPKQNEPSARGFIEQVQKIWTDGHIASKYPRLNPNDLLEVKVCIKIGLECVQIDRKSRPSIEKIVERLDGRCAN
ncbi:hypothetical protein ACQ4PT_048974 [Festuca glaucescens]